MVLFLADIMPDVTVPPKPKGFPIAYPITNSCLIESPNLTGVNLSLDSISKTARSESGSAPIIFALYSLSPFTLQLCHLHLE